MADFADIVEELKKTNKKLDRLGDAADPKGAAAAEDKREAQQAAARSENYLKTIAEAVSGVSVGADGLDPKDKQKGGLLAGIGGALGGLGIGAGVAMGGLGALFAGGGYLLKQIAEFDGKKVKENILELIGISDALEEKEGSLLKAFGKSGLLIFTLGGIGLGLAAFAVGTGVAAAIDKFTNSEEGQVADWATRIKDNLETLLSIDTISFADTAGLAATMAALSYGLIAFSFGTIAAVAAEGIADAISMFTDSGKDQVVGWATKIKDNIETLLSIDTISFADTAGLAATMTALSLGLIAFSGGTIAAAAATGIADAISMFTDSGTDQVAGWAEKIKENIEMLLSIDTISFADTAGLAATMTGLGAGLVAFSGGTAAAAIASGLDSAISMFTGKKEGMGTDWATKIKENIEKLLSINTEGVLKTAGLIVTMAALGGALIAFSFGSTAAAAATGIDSAISMFTGKKEGMGTGWAKKIKDEVEMLLSIDIGSGFGAWAKAILGLPAAMIGLSAGILAFSIGKAAGAAVEGFDSAISMFTGAKEGMGTGWAESIKDEVETLLSIKIGGLEAYAAAIVGFPLVMGSISAGLIFFSLGKMVATGAEAGAVAFSPSEQERKDAFDLFQKTGWAQTIVNEVTTLLKIAELKFFDAVEFVTTMGMVGAGLVAFSIGKLAAGAAEGLVTGVENTKKAITQFSTVGFAQKIVDEVTTLLTIAKLPLGNASQFVVTMGLIAGGLVAFSVGKGVAGGAEAVNRFAGIGQEGDKSFATKIKDEVTTLLSILDDISVQKATDFKTILGSISSGLLTFSGITFLSSLANVGTSVLSFLRGENSPIAEVMRLADKSEELKEGAEAISKIGDGLSKMASLKFDGKDINIKKFAEDLRDSVPVIEMAIMGGKEGFYGFRTKILGLASPDVEWEEASRNIRMLREALGGQAVADIGGRDGGAGETLKSKTIETLHVNTLVAQTLITNALEKSAAAAAGVRGIGTAWLNAPTNFDQRQTNMTLSSIPVENPNSLLAALTGAR